MVEHNMMHCLIPEPQLERLVDQNGLAHSGDEEVEEGTSYSLWPSSLMVCRKCWEVWVMSYAPAAVREVMAGKKILATVVVVNTGNGSCEEEDGGP